MESPRNFKVPILSCYEKWGCPIIGSALVFVGTRLDQKSDNFNVPSLSCYEKRRCSIICLALVFVGTRPDQKSDNFKVPQISSNAKRRCSIICRALVLVGTRAKQKSDNTKVPSELQRKEGLLHHLFCPGLCWHQTQQEFGQLQGAPSELL